MFSVSLHPSYSYTGYAEKGEQQGVFLKQRAVSHYYYLSILTFSENERNKDSTNQR